MTPFASLKHHNIYRIEESIKEKSALLNLNSSTSENFLQESLGFFNESNGGGVVDKHASYYFWWCQSGHMKKTFMVPKSTHYAEEITVLLIKYSTPHEGGRDEQVDNSFFYTRCFGCFAD